METAAWKLPLLLGAIALPRPPHGMSSHSLQVPSVSKEMAFLTLLSSKGGCTAPGKLRLPSSCCQGNPWTLWVTLLLVMWFPLLLHCEVSGTASNHGLSCC